MEKLRASIKPPPPELLKGLMNGVEYTKPGAGEWVKQSELQKIQHVLQPKCPDGTMNNLEPVRP